MRTKTIKIYTFDELSESAKENARNWYREGALVDDWWDCIYDDAKTIGIKIESFDLDRNRHATGNFINSPAEVAGTIIKEHGASRETVATAKAYLKYGDSEDFLKSLLEDYSIMLQREYEYLLSDECIDESIICNEYEFTENGKRA